MKLEEQGQVERLVSMLVETPGCDEAIVALNTMLLDRPDLQRYYARLLSMHVLLEGELTDASTSFAPLVSRSGKSVSAWPRGRQVPSAADPRWATTGFVALAVSLLLVALFIASGDGQYDNTASSASSPSISHHYEIENALFWTEDHQAATLVSRLTRTSTPSKLLLPSMINADRDFPQLIGGTAWMEYAPGLRERGRLVVQPPNTVMDVFIDTDASSQNTLSIVELNAYGVPVGDSYSVGNTIGDQLPSNIRTGWTGEFSQSNPTSSNRYFLFTGAYLDRRFQDSQRWAPSDFRTYVERKELMILGWDDRTYTTAKLDGTGLENSEEWQDCDYNDIRAIIRFASVDGTRLDESQATVNYFPEVDKTEYLKPARELGTGYTLSLQPGEEAYLMVTGYAALQNDIRIVDVANQRIVWHHGGVQRGVQWTDQYPSDRGAYVIRNTSNRVRQYELQSSCLTDRYRQLWRSNLHRLLTKDMGVEIVGFEDSPESTVNADWQDVLVAIYRFDMPR
ncbi:hypothetical protein [Aeoliella sp. SH292]|uniref:hypothetical protein n=1 Tax=Aeoliella sp. SH292 TaxID=3454464 RepID=UPI003F9A9BB4